ncbi:hypothetical protein AcV7_003515 [Taiwanofungus camphoratus]|nr:hypothetical protein AcV7_003515 [Antrodia cinnamomea]
MLTVAPIGTQIYVMHRTIIIQYLTLEDRFILSPRRPFINPMSGWRKHPSSCNLAWTPGIVGAIESIPLCFEAFRHSQAVRLVVIAEPSWVLQPRVWHAFAQSLHSFCETFVSGLRWLTLEVTP